MAKKTDVMINCERCERLFYIDGDIGRKRLDAKIPLLCLRCRKEIQNDNRRERMD